MTSATKIGIGFFAIIVVVALWLSTLGSTPAPLRPAESVSTSTSADATTSSTLPVLSGAVSDFPGIVRWWNTPNNQPLTANGLTGKVVLVDFWTYSCINCLRTLPFVRSLQSQYADKGLVIIGVHTPEFAFEADPTNVDAAIKKLGLTYPIALDANYQTWNAYQNQYWPAEYLFDRQGRLRHTQFGEGDYDVTEQAIRSLLNEGTSTVALGATVPVPVMPNFSLIGTNETYFGLARGQAFENAGGPHAQATQYTAIQHPSADQWTAGGTWSFQNEYAESLAQNNVFRFNVQASQAHLVLSSSDGKDKRIEISIDGEPSQTLTINAPTLYTVARFTKPGRHEIEIKIDDAGVRFYSATFS